MPRSRLSAACGIYWSAYAVAANFDFGHILPGFLRCCRIMPPLASRVHISTASPLRRHGESTAGIAGTAEGGGRAAHGDETNRRRRVDARRGESARI